MVLNFLVRCSIFTVEKIVPMFILQSKPLSNMLADASCDYIDNEIEENKSDSSNLTDGGLVVLAKWCPQLEKLSLIWCSNITSWGLKSIAEKCISLKSLDIQVYYFFIPNSLNLILSLLILNFLKYRDAILETMVSLLLESIARDSKS